MRVMPHPDQDHFFSMCYFDGSSDSSLYTEYKVNYQENYRSNAYKKNILVWMRYNTV